MTIYDTIEEALRAERPWLDEEVLRELYEEKRMSSIEIAQHFGNITDVGVRYWLDRHGIERRDHSEAAKARWEKLRSPEHLRRLADEIESAMNESSSDTTYDHSGRAPEDTGIAKDVLQEALGDDYEEFDDI